MKKKYNIYIARVEGLKIGPKIEFENSWAVIEVSIEEIEKNVTAGCMGIGFYCCKV
jgi:hypothetical protein